MHFVKKFFSWLIHFILEHLTLIGTILGSTYIIVSSQILAYSTNTLLIWIISLLGLIAVSNISEKYLRFNKLDKNINQIKDILSSTNNNLDEAFLTRKDLIPFEKRLENASSIILSGGSLARLSDEYYAYFEQKLSQKCKLEVILVKPFSQGANSLCKNVVYETKDEKAYSQKIQESLGRFQKLKNQFPDIVSIRLSNNTPPFGIIGVDLDKHYGKMQIELYSYAVPTRDRLILNVTKNNKLFQFFVDQINTLRSQSELI